MSCLAINPDDSVMYAKHTEDDNVDNVDIDIDIDDDQSDIIPNLHEIDI